MTKKRSILSNDSHLKVDSQDLKEELSNLIFNNLESYSIVGGEAYYDGEIVDERTHEHVEISDDEELYYDWNNSDYVWLNILPGGSIEVYKTAESRQNHMPDEYIEVWDYLDKYGSDVRIEELAKEHNMQYDPDDKDSIILSLVRDYRVSLWWEQNSDDVIQYSDDSLKKASDEAAEYILRVIK